MTSRVLVVDDSKTARKEVVRLIHNMGVYTVEAENGAEAIEQVKNHEDIVLIFCDVNMPVMDGISMAEEMKNDASIKDIPIIMITTEATTEVMTKAKSAGVKGWLVKPPDGHSIRSLVEKFVHAS
tara:strand:- start:145 stop:519 length:375 start_codon:yes stop_codon:yes gene_type:complete